MLFGSTHGVLALRKVFPILACLVSACGSGGNPNADKVWLSTTNVSTESVEQSKLGPLLFGEWKASTPITNETPQALTFSAKEVRQDWGQLGRDGRKVINTYEIAGVTQTYHPWTALIRFWGASAMSLKHGPGRGELCLVEIVYSTPEPKALACYRRPTVTSKTEEESDGKRHS